MSVSQFIHSSVDRHLGCFHFFAIMNIVAVSIPVQDFVVGPFSFPLGTYLVVELLSHMVTLCLTF